MYIYSPTLFGGPGNEAQWSRNLGNWPSFILLYQIGQMYSLLPLPIFYPTQPQCQTAQRKTGQFSGNGKPIGEDFKQKDRVGTIFLNLQGNVCRLETLMQIIFWGVETTPVAFFLIFVKALEYNVHKLSAELRVHNLNQNR